VVCAPGRHLVGPAGARSCCYGLMYCRQFDGFPTPALEPDRSSSHRWAGAGSSASDITIEPPAARWRRLPPGKLEHSRPKASRRDGGDRLWTARFLAPELAEAIRQCRALGPAFEPLLPTRPCPPPPAAGRWPRAGRPGALVNHPPATTARNGWALKIRVTIGRFRLRGDFTPGSSAAWRPVASPCRCPGVHPPLRWLDELLSRCARQGRHQPAAGRASRSWGCR